MIATDDERAIIEAAWKRLRPDLAASGVAKHFTEAEIAAIHSIWGRVTENALRDPIFWRVAALYQSLNYERVMRQVRIMTEGTTDHD